MDHTEPNRYQPLGAIPAKQKGSTGGSLAKPPFGKLRVENADHFAAVYVNDKFMGHVDEFSNFAQALLLNPGAYEVKVVPSSGGSPVTKSVTIEADKTVIVK